LAINFLLITRQNCDTEEKSAFCFEIVKLVSAVNVWVPFSYLFLEDHFMYVMKNKGSRIDPWGILWFTALQCEKRNSECT